MSLTSSAKSSAKVSSIVEYLGSENMGFLSRLKINPRGRMLSGTMGEHKSPLTGEGYEFALHRPYVRGDDIRRLDWNVYGRSDRLFIKRFEQTTELRGLTCLDVSGSMNFNGDPDGKRFSKLDLGRRLAAALAYMLLQQGDAVSLVIFGSKIHRMLPASSSPAQITRILEIIQEIEPETTRPGKEDPPMSQLLHNLAERFDRREMLILISDLMENPKDLSDALGHYRHTRHEGILFHLLDPLELDFPFRGWVRFLSLESEGDRQILESSGFRKAYMEALAEYLKTIRRACLLYGFDHAVCRSSRHWRDLLFDALTKRQLMKG